MNITEFLGNVKDLPNTIHRKINRSLMRIDEKCRYAKYDVIYWFRNLHYRIKYSIERVALNMIVELEKDSNYIKHFDKEFGDPEDCMDSMMKRQVIELLAVLSTHGDSGGSIGIKRNLLTKAMMFKILSPLKFTDEEFSGKRSIGDKESQQNTRLSSVFRDDDGIHDIHAMSHTTFNYRYDIAQHKLVEYEYGGCCWSGKIILYNNGEYHYYRFPIHNMTTYTGSNYCTIPTLEVYDSSDTHNDYFCNVAPKDAIPENFYTDYVLVLDWEMDQKHSDELKFCENKNIIEQYYKAKELQKTYVRK